MSERYKFNDPEARYFISPTIVDWIDVFSKLPYQDIVLDALQHAIDTKGLVINAWVIMPSHLHLIVRASSTHSLSDILREFKTFTNHAILKALMDGNDSRGKWILERFKLAAKGIKRVAFNKVWQDGNHPVLIDFMGYWQEKLHYLHHNPVKAGLVSEPAHYRLSSAIDYAGGKGLLPVELLM